MLIRWTKPAVEDLRKICDFTQERFGPAQGRKTALALYDAAESLNRFPMRGRVGRKLRTRELVVTGYPFLIIYRVQKGTVEVLRLLHGAQNWPSS